ncbi:hypothetical protein [Vibrio porteresiae]|uniref:Uncharacterized protein n=1 Tax=Vibrio porteresiae DSM 19223 TaxID=1123496 RepID=A0ABZ0Q8B9_9VIBR|nr:hypothetical protein [Vibrio porteresiae]WPC72684.1 hypothetical protein R8Z52_11150 [Vibrio porteresiae DSM 19223]
MTTPFDVQYPKKAPLSLVKKTLKALNKIGTGAARFRVTNRYGYQTLSLGGADRLVKLGDTIVVFNRHSDYETFIDNPRRC